LENSFIYFKLKIRRVKFSEKYTEKVKMNLENSKVLILGGWGLVGGAISKKLIGHNVKTLIISSLRQEEAEDAIKDLRKEFGENCPELKAEWGNLFTREEWKDIHYSTLLNDSETRMEIIKDTFLDLDDNIKENSFLFKLIAKHKPDLVIDCINTATGIAYSDVYKSSLTVINDFDNGVLDKDNVEMLMASTYIPQLIRHIQLLAEGLSEAKSKMYIKVGTSGTGGMGLNIPYTHSEDKPSRVLMSKNAVAGAQTLLMYLMARTPNSTIVKEIKPAATIAWKKITFDTVKKGGKSVRLYDMDMKDAFETKGEFDFENNDGVVDTGEDLKSVFIDTGENGIFSKNEFETISSLGQMEIVTPEEIADYLIFEAMGGNTGKDMIQGIDAFALGPTYRGGFLRNKAIKMLENLEEEKGIEGVAFELLGPPRLSKLLFESHILKLIYGDFNSFINDNIRNTREKVLNLIESNDGLRKQILSIGLPILINNEKFLKGQFVKVPVRIAGGNYDLNSENIDKWCSQGWIDLRESNLQLWQDRFKNIMSDSETMKYDTTSSRNYFDNTYWNNFNEITPGKIAGWIFEKEENGWRFKR